MIIEEFLKDIKQKKRKFMHAYECMNEFLRYNIEGPTNDYEYQMARSRVLALDRINDSLEQLAIDMAWWIQRIKHPIRMYELIQDCKEEDSGFRNP